MADQSSFEPGASGGGVPTSRAVATTSPLSGGGDLSADRTLSVDLSGYVPTSRTVSAGAGLSGGGDLSANRTFALGTSGVTAATYQSPVVTFDQYGRATSASNGSYAWEAAHKPASTGAYDCEFEGALTGGWVLGPIAGDITDINTAPVSLRGNYGRPVNGVNTWLMGQSPASGAANILARAPISLGSAAWFVARVSWAQPPTPLGVDGFVGLYVAADSGGSPDLTKCLFITPQLAGVATYGKQDSGYTAVGTAATQQSMVLLVIAKSGSDYTAYVGCDGSMIHMGSTTVTWTPAHVMIVVGNTLGSYVAGVDYVRYETTTYPHLFGG